VKNGKLVAKPIAVDGLSVCPAPIPSTAKVALHSLQRESATSITVQRRGSTYCLFGSLPMA
jgi:hypothetical protein